MPEFRFLIGLTFTAQTIAALVVTFLLYGFYRTYRKSYLFHWTLSSLALAVYQLSAALATAATQKYQLAPSDPLRLGLDMITSAAAYLHVGWTVFGVYELIRRRHVRLRESKLVIYSLAGFGMIMATLFTTEAASPAARHVARYGVYAFLAAIAFAGAALALWRTRTGRRSVGSVVLSAGFAGNALQQIQHGILGWTSFGYADLLIQSVIGLGMIACLLEDEREAAELAAGEIEHLAYHDALTGLPNRPLFMDRLIVSLAQANRANHKLAVFFLDLDRFKDINDSLGHSVGDALLKSVAERIRRCVREGDTVARFGGDEFTLLIPKIDHIEDAAKIAQKIIETLKIPFSVYDREHFVTTSIGVSISPSDGLDPETLVRNADTAMYRAKDQGRDNYQLYAPAMNARAAERLALENRLRKAVSQNELVLHFQPLVSTQSGNVIGVEALIRWNHPEQGLLSPFHFISVAEVSGLIVPIGEWVIRTACKQIKVWQKKFNRDLIMAVNLSARQFQQADLIEQIREAVQETGIEPESLELEITESNAMQNAENTIYTLRELKVLGVRISMDDFGTGYSSLNYLKRFPIDTLKLDQTFIRDVNKDPSDAAIVSSVIAMAHNLNLKVVAEGVERKEQLDFLTRQGCDIVQGYYFSKPLPPESLELYLAEHKVKMAAAASS
jgi:diguanylate cyclase (GGDEF)-like protein